MLQLVGRGVLFLVPVFVLSSCGVTPESRVDSSSNSVPNYLIARVDVSDKNATSASVDFVSVTSEDEIATTEAAEKAFLNGQTIRPNESGIMHLGSSSEVELKLGSPAQMQTQSPAQMSKTCYGKNCAPVQMQTYKTYNQCDCSYGNGIVRSNQNTVLFPRLRAFFRGLNPYAKVNNQQYGYNYGNQYSQGQYQYTVYKQDPSAPGNSVTQQQPGGQYQLPYPSQRPGNQSSQSSQGGM